MTGRARGPWFVGLLLSAGVIGLILVVWPSNQEDLSPTPALNRSVQQASATDPGRVPLERVTQRAVPPDRPILRLLSEPEGGKIPPSEVIVTTLGSGTSPLRARIVDGTITLPGTGEVRIESGEHPPLFGATQLQVGPGLTEVRVVPMVTLALRLVNMRGEPGVYADLDVGLGLAEAAQIAIIGNTGKREQVRKEIASMSLGPIVDGQSVLVWPRKCIVARGNDVIAIQPAHPSWYGEMIGDSVLVPGMGGASCPASAPIVGTPGATFKVTVVVGRAGGIAIDLSAWPLGELSVVIRRAGYAGIDTISNSWKVAASRTLNLTVETQAAPLLFPDLPPGAYKVDLASYDQRTVTCATLPAFVEDIKTLHLSAERGMGSGSLLLNGVRNGDTILAHFPTRAPAQAAPGMEWSQIFMIGVKDERLADHEQVTIRGLHERKGSLTVTRGAQTMHREIDLAQQAIYSLSQ